MTGLVLASASKTRAVMLENAGVKFTVDPAKADEEALKEALITDAVPPRDMADALAELKARSVSYLHPGDMVLGADQILVQDGRIFSKAKNRQDARETLKALSGNRHELISAAVIYCDGHAVWRALSSAKLTVRPLSDEFIETYLDQIGEAALWSVGCYQIEGPGVQLFTQIEGNHHTILGLPLLEILDFLRRRSMMPV